ncbi:unnamed protein product [[Candida] boidinii]|nr:unnamed protein product [[Candida] boidinii]
MSSLCETFDKELADKDEEIEENIKNINNVKNEVQITNKRNKRLLKNILGGIDENSGELIVNSNFDELISIVDRENEQIMKDPSSTSSSALLTLGEDISPVDISKKINEEVQDRVNNFKEALVEKSNELIKLAERSQALELACLVRDEEGNINLSDIKSADNEHDDSSIKVKSEKDGGNNSTSEKDPGSSNSTSRASTFSDHDHDLTMDSSFDSENGSNIIGERAKSGKNKLTLAIELTLLQLNRRKLINSLVTAYSGTKSILGPVQNDGLGIITDSKSIKDSESSLGDDDIESMTIDSESIDTVTDGILSKFDGSRLHLFKRLISNICDLQIEEIDEKLLSAIEMRLLDNGKSPGLGATPRFV